MRRLPYFSLWLCAGSAVSAAPVQEFETLNRDSLVPRVQFLEDPAGRLTLPRLLAEKRSAFRPSPGRKPSFGQSDSAYWLRFAVRNGAARARLYYVQIEFPRLDLIDYYELPEKEDRILRETRTGDSFPFAQRPVRRSGFAFPLRLQAGEGRRIYLRVRTRGVTQVPLVIRDAKSFHARGEGRKLLLGAYYGILFVMGIYNLALLGAMRDRVYAYYTLLIFGFALYQMTSNGIAYEYLWPESPRWNDRAIPFFTAVACIGTILFSTRFLETRRFTPRLHKLYTALLGGGILCALFSLTEFYIAASNVLRLLVMVFIVAIIISSIQGLRRGYRPAFFFLLAWSGYLTGIVLFVLQLRGWLDSNPFTESAMQIGSAVEVFLLSLGLADRIQTIRRQKDQARTRAWKNGRLALKRMREANKLKDEFLARLDLQVRERTAELNTALEGLRERDETIRFELDMARGIQSAILPTTPGPETNYTWTVHYEALEEVGGDFYDLLPVPGGGAEFSNAGHIAPFILRAADGAAEMVEVPGVFLGGIEFDADPYRVDRRRLHPGDRIFMFTDGITEATNSKKDLYGDERLLEIARANRHESKPVKRFSLIGALTWVTLRDGTT